MCKVILYVCRRKALRLAFLPENRLQMPSLPGCRRASGLQRGPPVGDVWPVSQPEAGRSARRFGPFRNALRPSLLRGGAGGAKWFYTCGAEAGQGLRLQTYLFFPRLETFLPPKSAPEAPKAAYKPPAAPLFGAKRQKHGPLFCLFRDLCYLCGSNAAPPQGRHGGAA